MIAIWFPETKGRSPAELDYMFEHRLPARQFKGYVCAVPAEEVLAGGKRGLRLREMEMSRSNQSSSSTTG